MFSLGYKCSDCESALSIKPIVPMEGADDRLSAMFARAQRRGIPVNSEDKHGSEEGDDRRRRSSPVMLQAAGGASDRSPSAGQPGFPEVRGRESPELRSSEKFALYRSRVRKEGSPTYEAEVIIDPMREVDPYRSRVRKEESAKQTTFNDPLRWELHEVINRFEEQGVSAHALDLLKETKSTGRQVQFLFENPIIDAILRDEFLIEKDLDRILLVYNVKTMFEDARAAKVLLAQPNLLKSTIGAHLKMIIQIRIMHRSTKGRIYSEKRTLPYRPFQKY